MLTVFTSIIIPTAANIVQITVKIYSDFYNNCLISRALIGSFLSSIRVQTDKILIYASFQVKLSAVKLSTF